MIRIAIADDHQALVDGVKLILNNVEDIEVVATANNGKDLVELIPLKKPDVVLTDIKMPLLDGYEVAKKLKESWPKIKVIAFSMFDDANSIEKMKLAGAKAYLLKNSPLATIKKAIYEVHEGGEFFAEACLKPAQRENKGMNFIKLTKTERKILELIAQGKSTKEIAEIRGSAESTVDKHRKNMMRKLNLNGKGELVKYAYDVRYEL